MTNTELASLHLGIEVVGRKFMECRTVKWIGRVRRIAAVKIHEVRSTKLAEKLWLNSQLERVHISSLAT